MVDAGCQYASYGGELMPSIKTGDGPASRGSLYKPSQDHLTITKHAGIPECEKGIFDSLPESAFAITNSDDKNGAVMLGIAWQEIYLLCKGWVIFKARIFEKHFDGTEIEINGKELIVQFVGVFNVYNLLAVYGTAVLLGQQPDELLRS